MQKTSLEPSGMNNFPQFLKGVDKNTGCNLFQLKLILSVVVKDRISNAKQTSYSAATFEEMP